MKKSKIFLKKISLLSSAITTVICSVVSIFVTYHIAGEQTQTEQSRIIEANRVKILKDTQYIFSQNKIAKDVIFRIGSEAEYLKERKETSSLNDLEVRDIANKLKELFDESLSFDAKLSVIESVSELYFCHNLKHSFYKLKKNGSLWWSEANEETRNEILKEMHRQIKNKDKCEKN